MIIDGTQTLRHTSGATPVSRVGVEEDSLFQLQSRLSCCGRLSCLLVRCLVFPRLPGETATTDHHSHLTQNAGQFQVDLGLHM